MTNDGLRRLPPPPLFTIRPPPKPPGSLFENFQTVEILNGQCIRAKLSDFNGSTSNSILKHEQQINWLNVFLIIFALIIVVSCIIILTFIFICLKKLKKEEKEYKNYMTTSSLSSRNHHHHHHPPPSQHYQYTLSPMNCCDDYYSHQIIPLTENPLSSDRTDNTAPINTGGIETSQIHQYECIPEYLLTMNRHNRSIICQHNTCSVPYATFSRSLILSRNGIKTNTSDSSQCTCSSPPSATAVQEESSTPLLESKVSSPKSMIIGWTKRKSNSSNENSSPQQSFLSQFRKSSVVQ